MKTECNPDSDTLVVKLPEAPRFESNSPSGYRLARKPNGEIVLQGAFHWQQGFVNSGFEWRDIPTVDLEA